MSKYSDGLIIVHTAMTDPHDKGDLMLSSAFVIETAYFMATIAKKTDVIFITDSPLTHAMRGDKQGTIVVKHGYVPVEWCFIIILIVSINTVLIIIGNGLKLSPIYVGFTTHLRAISRSSSRSTLRTPPSRGSTLSSWPGLPPSPS